MQLFKRFSVIDDLMYGNTLLKVEKALSDSSYIEAAWT